MYFSYRFEICNVKHSEHFLLPYTLTFVLKFYNMFKYKPALSDKYSVHYFPKTCVKLADCTLNRKMPTKTNLHQHQDVSFSMSDAEQSTRDDVFSSCSLDALSRSWHLDIYGESFLISSSRSSLRVFEETMDPTVPKEAWSVTVSMLSCYRVYLNI